MQYLEDIIELVEDLPEEIGRRFEQMRKWDNDVERLRLECKYAAKRIMEVRETSQPMREKILMELADKYRLIHRLSERKLDLAIRSERLMSAVLEKVADSSYLCKIELEVDNPGCTEAIEKNFCRMLGLKPTSSHLTSCNVEFEPMEDVKSITHGQQHDVNGELTSAFDLKDPALSSINGKPDRERFGSPSPRVTPCDSPQPTSTSASRLKKRKYNSGTPPPTVSNYTRRKQERERERMKLNKIHAARQEEYRRKQQKMAMASEPDLASFSGGTNDSGLGGVLDEDVALSEDVKWKEQDPLGSDDDFDANDVLGLFPSLPSPPREIMESLKEDSLFPDDDFMGYETHATTFPQSPAMQGLLLDSAASSPSPSTSASSWDRKKRTSISFGNVNETTSLHGRPRKMTERAVELLQNHKDREKFKRSGVKAESVDGEGNERWCFCREVSSGSMICCDDPDCKYQWFHFECVGLVVEPKGQWFCSECSMKKR
ncbi:PHD-finger [Ostertagia ostertagi]